MLVSENMKCCKIQQWPTFAREPGHSRQYENKKVVGITPSSKVHQ